MGFDKEAVEDNRLWVSVRESYGGMAYNSDVIKPEDAPKTWEDIAKGFEFAKDQYVMLDDEDLDTLEIDSIHAIDVVNFVPLEQIELGLRVARPRHRHERDDPPLAPVQRVGNRPRVGLGTAVEQLGADAHARIARAELVHLPRATEDAEAVRRLLAGEFDAYAANTERLAAVAADEPRIRIVEGSLMNAEQSIVVTLHNDAGIAVLNRTIDELRTSGFLQDIVDRYRIAGVEVAPPGIR